MSGGSAFPNAGDHGWCIRDEGCRISTGMSLRDWFAGQAVAGWLANGREPDRATTDAREAANCAYILADEMLARRERKP